MSSLRPYHSQENKVPRTFPAVLLYTPEATVAQTELNFLHDVKLLFNKQFSDDGVNFQGSFTLSLSLDLLIQ